MAKPATCCSGLRRMVLGRGYREAVFLAMADLRLAA